MEHPPAFSFPSPSEDGLREADVLDRWKVNHCLNSEAFNLKPAATDETGFTGTSSTVRRLGSSRPGSLTSNSV